MWLPRRARGRIWKLTGLTLILSGILLAVAIEILLGKTGVSLPGFIVLCFGAVGFACFRRGQKLVALTAEELLSKDARPPVLYLRSFEEDTITSQWSEFKKASDYFNPLGKNMDLGATEEMNLARVMKQIGPFITIGRPSEKLPELGAARIYFEASCWQEKVAQLIGRSRLVVFRFGTAVCDPFLLRVVSLPAIFWEFQKASELLSPKSLLLLIAHSTAKEYDVFRRNLSNYFPHPLPNFPKPGVLNRFYQDRINAVIYFSADWNSHVIPLRGKKRKAGLARELERALTPVAKGLGCPWKKPITMRRRVLLMGIAGLVLLLTVINVLDSVSKGH